MRADYSNIGAWIDPAGANYIGTSYQINVATSRSVEEMGTHVYFYTTMVQD